MTRDEAVSLFDSKFWESLTHRQRAEFQMFQDRLCMPFDVFHEAVEKALGRSVWTHEFGLNRDGLTEELLGHRLPPSVREIMDLIPADKRICIAVGSEAQNQ